MIRKFRLIPLLAFLMACSPSDRALVEKADQEALRQRASLSKYLYLQVLERRSERDALRYRAWSGLVNVATNQLFDYKLAGASIEQMIKEFEGEPFFKPDLPRLRLQASRIYRLNLQNPDRALQILMPTLESGEIAVEFEEEFGNIFLSKGKSVEAEAHFRKAFEKSLKARDCVPAQRAQLLLIQSLVLNRSCDRAFQWMDHQLFEGCSKQEASIEIERANCFEQLGDPQKAMATLDELAIRNPQDKRISFILSSLRKRIKQTTLR